MSDTTITLRGRIGTDLRVSKSANNHLTIRFRLAVTHWFASADGVLTQGRTQWYSVHAWDRLADNALHSLAKGEPVIVTGRPRANAWKDSDGNIRSEVVINAQAIGHDLTSGRSTWRKSMPSPSGGGSALSSGDEAVATLTSTSDVSGANVRMNSGGGVSDPLGASFEDSPLTASNAIGEESEGDSAPMTDPECGDEACDGSCGQEQSSTLKKVTGKNRRVDQAKVKTKGVFTYPKDKCPEDK
ncbi:single-stranded DNA-binding protein [Pauljensenia sp. UMB1235]|uniref:single-stranded DNA-binding protein n=1 Tax=unclassified Pauljensenia TaxID=2908895 RepID=UPI00254BBBE3|nr:MULTISPECIES: single-stranded DNA-binding protein [unclassified Pauljensenia]MDK6400191.1 single-stranded DNA-binding protein [Pauljensenia sp. UMB9872]MDK7172715.1 single-stranded DNA-binding protein [Pauljensenia sp. UMB1235]